MIRGSIDIRKINRDWGVEGKEKNGVRPKYVNIALIPNREGKDAYGNDGMIIQDVPKEIRERDETIKGPILGNYKTFERQQQKPREQQRQQRPATPPPGDDGGW